MAAAGFDGGRVRRPFSTAAFDGGGGHFRRRWRPFSTPTAATLVSGGRVGRRGRPLLSAAAAASRLIGCRLCVIVIVASAAGGTLRRRHGAAAQRSEVGGGAARG